MAIRDRARSKYPLQWDAPSLDWRATLEDEQDIERISIEEHQYFRVTDSQGRRALTAVAPLEAAFNLVVPEVGSAAIPSGLTLETFGHLIVLMREPGLLAKGLLVDQGPMGDGPVVTVVFNLSSESIRIKRGDVLSRLVRLPI